MAKRKLTKVKITDTKKTKREKLIDEAKSLGLDFQDSVTIKELTALIQTEKLKADLPAPPPPPPTMSFVTLQNKNVIVTVKAIGKNGPARLLQGLTEKNGIESWNNLCVISPAGAPKIVLKAQVREDTLKLTQPVKKIRLLEGGEKGPELESMKL